MFQNLRLLFKEHLQISWYYVLSPCVVMIIQFVRPNKVTLYFLARQFGTPVEGCRLSISDSRQT